MFVLGFKHTDKWKKLKKRDCEFCFLVIVGWNMTIPRPDPMNAISPNDLGSFQVIYGHGGTRRNLRGVK